MKKFKKGDRCRIIGNTSSHFFKIGQDVVLNGRVSENGFYEANDMNSSFWVKPEDMELIEPELKATDLTMQEKFEQGWEIRHNIGVSVIEIGTLPSGRIATVWEDFRTDVFKNEADFLRYHTITPPAPKVEKMFSPVYWSNGNLFVGFGRKTLEDSKLAALNTTCIIEHEKQGDKWVFVKAHNI